MGPLLAIPAIVSGITQGITGLVDKGKAREAERKAQALQTGIDTDLNRMASTGLPQEQYEQGMQNISRNLSYGISALRDRRSALAGIPLLTQRANDAQLGLDVANAKQRVLNQDKYIGFKTQLMGQERQRQQQLEASGRQNAFSGFMNALTAGTSLANSIINKVGMPKNVGMSGGSTIQSLGKVASVEPVNPVKNIQPLGGINGDNIDWRSITGSDLKI